MYCPPEEYARDPAQFMSEFGLQAPPSVDSLRRFIPQDELWPPGPAWKYHRAQLGKLRHYALPFLAQVAEGRTPGLDDFVEASQRAQARGLQIAIEHARRNKYAMSGFAVWQFNSPWPGIDWSLVDYYGVPKLAYERLKELANPLLVCLNYELRRYSPGDPWTAQVWVINDLPREFAACQVEVAWSGGGQEFQVNVGADSAACVGRVSWALPRNGWRVQCRLKQGERVLATNRYHLREYDGRRPWWRAV
jgi:beta-mannosidase